MVAIFGIIVVIGSVIGGFTIAGGRLMALFHISEIVTIVGTAAGTVLISTPANVVGEIARKLGMVLQPTPFTKQLYLEALKMLYELFQLARRDGLVAIESHIEGPEKSALFKKYPAVLKQHHAMVYLCDSLRLVLVGSVPPHDLEQLLSNEIEVHHEQEARPAASLQRVSDSLPGIGIVAAVLGIVVTMGAISGPVEQIGEHVAAALTGTFLGVLLAYGFTSPLSTGIENVNQTEGRFYSFIKEAVVAFAKGLSPIVAVEFARRSVFHENRPTFTAMEAACKSVKAK
jgi:chemotaxis protein MotA